VQTDEKQATTEKKPFGIITTLAERGPVLPLGTIDPTTGAWRRSMVHNRWNFATEKKIALLREKNPKANLAQYVGMVLATMYSELGAHNLAAHDDKHFSDRRALVSSMFMGDVFYAYVWLRTAVLGHELKIKITCPHCQESYPFVADLRTVEVRSFEKLDDALYTYQLHDPIEMRGGVVSGLLLGPPRWNAFEQAPPGSPDVGLVKFGLVRSALQGLVVEGEVRKDVAPSSDELDEMSKWDLEHIASEIGARALGPKMAIEDSCQNERCGRELKLPLDWGYDGFFAASST